MKVWIAPILGALIPLLFWLFHWQGWPYWVIGFFLLPLAWRHRTAISGGIGAGLVAAALGLFAVLTQSEVAVRLYPVLVNGTFLILFATSLRGSMPVIERIARLSEPNLPPEGVRYTRQVTQAWCLFFLINGAISLITVLIGNEQLWLLYNGLISYVLIGSMFGGEWLLRQRLRHRG